MVVSVACPARRPLQMSLQPMIRTTLRFAVVLSAFAMAVASAPSAVQAQECNVVVQSDDALRYLPHAIEVPRTCKDFTVTLTHSGRLPVLAMGHNWVLARPEFAPECRNCPRGLRDAAVPPCCRAEGQ